MKFLVGHFRWFRAAALLAAIAVTGCATGTGMKSVTSLSDLADAPKSTELNAVPKPQKHEDATPVVQPSSFSSQRSSYSSASTRSPSSGIFRSGSC